MSLKDVRVRFPLWAQEKASLSRDAFFPAQSSTALFGEGGILPLTPSPPKWPLKPLESTFNGEGVGPEIPPSPNNAYQQVAGDIPLEAYAQIYSVAVLTSQPTGIP